MPLLEVALQVIAIIAIIAVGAFVIVFLSDLLISIIDDHQGIFFKKNKGRDETPQPTRMYEPNYENNKVNTVKEEPAMARGFEFDFEQAPQKVEQKVSSTSAKKNNVDFEAAKKEQEMIERAKQNFFDEEETDESSKEEIEQKERIAKLEERNRQLEEELKTKASTPKEVKKELPKFEDLNKSFNEKDLEEIDEDDFDDENMDDYEKLIKQINEQVKTEFEQKQNGIESKPQPTVEQKPQPKVEPKPMSNHFMNTIIDDEEDFDEEEDLDEEIETKEQTIKQDEKYTSLAQELAALKEQLEQERKERELLKLEAEEKQEKLMEEKILLEEALKSKKQDDSEKKTVVVMDSEEEYVARLEILEERLREAKKQLRKNKREFVPLNKIKRTLEKDQVKLRRKEAQVAKQKVALFGVNNSDIDPVKQAELEQEIDMLEGLKLSVQHCEDVIRENSDRYPVLEQTHQILSKNVKNLTSDIESIEAKLKEIRKKKSE